MIDVEMNSNEFEELCKYYGINRTTDTSTILQEDDWSIQLDCSEKVHKDNIAFYPTGEIYS